MCEKRLSGELAAIEAALCSLTPAPSGIQRDRLMFLAGEASVNRKSIFGVRRLAAAFCGIWTNSDQCREAEKAAASRRTPNLLWPVATAASLLAAATFGVLWATGNKPILIDTTTAISVASAPIANESPADTSPPSPWANRRLCQLVLEKGVDAMPDSTVYGVSLAPYVPRDDSSRGLLKQYLANPAG